MTPLINKYEIIEYPLWDNSSSKPLLNLTKGFVRVSNLKMLSHWTQLWKLDKSQFIGIVRWWFDNIVVSLSLGLVLKIKLALKLVSKFVTGCLRITVSRGKYMVFTAVFLSGCFTYWRLYMYDVRLFCSFAGLSYFYFFLCALPNAPSVYKILRGCWRVK